MKKQMFYSFVLATGLVSVAYCKGLVKCDECSEDNANQVCCKCTQHDKYGTVTRYGVCTMEWTAPICDTVGSGNCAQGNHTNPN